MIGGSSVTTSNLQRYLESASTEQNFSNNSIPLVSVIIGNFNGRKYIQACLESLSRQSFQSLEIIFVDDGSTDGSVAFVTENFPHVRTTRNPRKEKGYAACCDSGARIASGQYLCFLNPDVELDSKCIQNLVLCLESSPAIGACGPKLLSLAKRNVLVSAGGFLDLFGFGIDRGIDEVDTGKYLHPEDVNFITGAVILIRASALWKAGGWDVDTFTYAEDSDLCWRILLLDYRIVYEPKAVSYHAQSPTMGRASSRKIYFMERNRLTSMEKNYSIPTLFRVIPSWSVLAIARVLYFLSCRRADIVSSTIRAYIASLRSLPRTLKKRALIQTRRRVADEEILKMFSRRSFEVSLLISDQPKLFRV
jgi:GT2 family glycosyltransferase